MTVFFIVDNDLSIGVLLDLTGPSASSGQTHFLSPGFFAEVFPEELPVMWMARSSRGVFKSKGLESTPSFSLSLPLFPN